MMASLLLRGTRRWLLGLAVLPILVPLESHAARRIVYLGFTGPSGAEATRLVSRFLTGRFELIGRARFVQEARRRGLSPGSAGGRSTAARALKAVAVVSGSLARSSGLSSLRVTVYSAHNGMAVGNLSYPVRGLRIDLLTARRVANGILPAVARARPGAAVALAAAPARRPAARPGRPRPVAVQDPDAPPRPRRNAPDFDDGSTEADDDTASRADENDGGEETTDSDEQDHDLQPVPPPRKARRSAPADRVDGDNLGFDLADAGDEGVGAGPDDQGSRGRRGKKAATAAQLRKPRSGRAPYEKIVEASLGLMLLGRSFEFNDAENAPKYNIPVVPAIVLDGGLFPFALLGRNPLANLGLVGSYYRVPVLRSNVDGNETDTTLHQFEAGLRYRWNILGKASSPTLRAGLSFGRLGFVIHYDEGYDNSSVPIPLPNIVYLYLKFALVSLEVPFYTGRIFSVGGLLSFDYLYVFSAGDIERTDSGGYGPSNTGGIDLGGGVYATLGGFFLKITGFYRRMFYAFEQTCIDTSLGCKTAGGALDIYQGATFLVGYAF